MAVGHRGLCGGMVVADDGQGGHEEGCHRLEVRGEKACQKEAHRHQEDRDAGVHDEEAYQREALLRQEDRHEAGQKAVRGEVARGEGDDPAAAVDNDRTEGDAAGRCGCRECGSHDHRGVASRDEGTLGNAAYDASSPFHASRASHVPGQVRGVLVPEDPLTLPHLRKGPRRSPLQRRSPFRRRT